MKRLIQSGLWCVFVFGTLLIPAPAAYAQDTTIAGTITDSTDAVLPGVTVTATHVDTGNTFVGVTDAAGQYRVGPVRPGVYRVTSELPGFTTVTQDNLELLLGQRIVVNVRMTVSTVSETVTVTGEAPIVEVGRTRMSGNIDPRQMQELPVLGRNWMDLSMLAPGSRTNAVDESPIGGGDSTGFQLNIDGQQVTSMVSNAANGQPRFSRDAIAEFEMVTNRFDATQGRSMQAQVNAITRSGTNQFAGSLGAYFRDDNFNAADFIVGRVLPYSNQQISGTFGGPIRRDRVHFFGNYEYSREPTTYTFTSPYPRFNLPDLTLVRAETKSGLRVDTQFNTDTRLMGRANHFKVNLPSSAGGPATHPSRRSETTRWSTQYLATLTQVMGPTLVHELKGGWNQFRWVSVGVVPFSPQVTLRSYSFGEPSNFNQTLDQHGYQARSDWTWIASGHEVKFGAEVLTNTTCVCPWLQFADGNLNATGGPVPANIEDLFPVWNDPSTWNLAALSPITVFYEQSVGQYEWEDEKFIYAGYLQDNWALSKNFTLNLGLRYDLSLGAMAEDVVFEPFLPEPRESDTDNFQPRVGFAYTLTDRTVIRGGVGKYFAEFTDSPNFATNLAVKTVNLRVLNDGRPDFAANPFNGPIPTFEQAVTFPNRSLSVDIVSEGMSTPYSWQTSIGVQQQLATALGVQADYVFIGTRGDHAHPATKRENNLSFNPETGVNYPFSDISKRPFVGWGSVGIQRTDGRTNRHAIDMALTKRFSDNWQASATYSLGWLYSYDPLPPWQCYYGPGDFRPCPSTMRVAPDLGGEYGLAAGDQRHRAVFNGIWHLPYALRLSGLYFFGSGQRQSVTYGADLRGRGLASGRLRPDGSIIPRNEFVGDEIHRVDLRLGRSFPIVADVKVEGIFEVFNVFNHANYGSYVTNEASPQFGRPSQNVNVAYQPRMLQLGFRVEF